MKGIGTQIDLSGRNLKRIPPSIFKLSSITHLILHSNHLTNVSSVSVEQWGRLKKLQLVDLSNSEIEEFPVFKGVVMASLETLLLAENRITDVEYSEGLKYLKHLDISSNKFTEFPVDVLKFTNLQVLYMSSNEIGSVPPGIVQLTNLRTLRLSNSKMTQFPMEILDPRLRLEEIDFSRNEIATVPPEISNLRETIKRIYLNDNKIQRLPKEMSDLVNLSLLWVNDNRLTEFPVCLALPSLESLRLDNNQIRGTIPQSFVLGAKNLRFINVRHNPMLLVGEDARRHLSKILEPAPSRGSRRRRLTYNVPARDGRGNDPIDRRPKGRSGLTAEWRKSMSDGEASPAGDDDSDAGDAKVQVPPKRAKLLDESGIVWIVPTAAKDSLDANDVTRFISGIKKTISNTADRPGEPPFGAGDDLEMQRMQLERMRIELETERVFLETKEQKLRALDREIKKRRKELEDQMALLLQSKRQLEKTRDIALNSYNEINPSELEFVREIGSGSYGVVFEARWHGTRVAVKRIKKEFVRERYISIFKREITMASRARHPNVVLFMAACTVPPNILLVTEYCENKSLTECLAEGRFVNSLEEKLRIARGIARGMNYLHKLGIIHRDLKSLNILIDKYGEAKIADFGMSRFLDKDKVAMTAFPGSPCWMAPETIKKEKYTEKVDVYAFGIVLWEIYTRKFPYREYNNPINLAVQVCFHGLRPDIGLVRSGKWADLIKRCWHPLPEQRPSFSEILDVLAGIDEL